MSKEHLPNISVFLLEAQNLEEKAFSTKFRQIKQRLKGYAFPMNHLAHLVQ